MPGPAPIGSPSFGPGRGPVVLLRPQGLLSRRLSWLKSRQDAHLAPAFSAHCIPQLTLPCRLRHRLPTTPGPAPLGRIPGRINQSTDFQRLRRPGVRSLLLHPWRLTRPLDRLLPGSRHLQCTSLRPGRHRHPYRLWRVRGSSPTRLALRLGLLPRRRRPPPPLSRHPRRALRPIPGPWRLRPLKAGLVWTTPRGQTQTLLRCSLSPPPLCGRHLLAAWGTWTQSSKRKRARCPRVRRRTSLRRAGRRWSLEQRSPPKIRRPLIPPILPDCRYLPALHRSSRRVIPLVQILPSLCRS